MKEESLPSLSFSASSFGSMYSAIFSISACYDCLQRMRASSEELGRTAFSMICSSIFIYDCHVI